MRREWCGDSASPDVIVSISLDHFQDALFWGELEFRKIWRFFILAGRRPIGAEPRHQLVDPVEKAVGEERSPEHKRPTGHSTL